MGEQKGQTAGRLSGLAEGVVGDVERLVGQHLALLRSEVKQELGEARDAAVSLMAGAGAGAAAGLLGALGAVHLLHRLTGLPLWACHWLVAGGLGLAGSGLLAQGARKASDLSLVPKQTAAALQEELTPTGT